MRKFFYYLITVIAVSSIICMVSCASNSDPTSSQETGLIDNSGNVIPITVTNTVDVTNYYSNYLDKDGTYYKIYVPWAVSGDGYFTVSYTDTNRLKQLWLDQIKRKGVNDGKVFAIRNRANDRDRNNFQKPHDGRQDYYYFADNGDIYYKGGDITNKTGETLMKRFMGAVIIDYRRVKQREAQSPTYAADQIERTGKLTVGGIYKMAINVNEARSKFHDANGGPTDGTYEFIAARKRLWTFFNGVWGEFSWFTRQYHNTEFIEVLVLNPDAAEGNSDCAGLDAYYAYFGNINGVITADLYKNLPYMQDENIYLGERPEWIAPLLNSTTTFTDASRWWSFLVMPGEPETAAGNTGETTERKTTGRLPRWSW